MSRIEQEKQFAMRVATASRKWRQMGDQALKRLGLSSASGWCLVYIDRLGDNPNQVELARTVGVREPTIVRMLAGLEKSGLITRSPDPEDARAKIIALTPQGTDIVKQVENSLRMLRHDLLANVSDADLAAALHVLDEILTARAEWKDA
ncbi:MarR family winged helix-turn-helix transcriptional regulator [Croceicoccus mobilis]|uniref:MarR family transcriptional regulator n=1 Tax=Croceicoccus mobilis TaxID=1703339 RepID=A0A916Z6A6_9SPHN|nr:MarR family transcriptional regulator [Croceicoccus mobilis]GGD78626.1 MarR family transcriptional regulator [Croceicoccus mobilis]